MSPVTRSQTQSSEAIVRAVENEPVDDEHDDIKIFHRHEVSFVEDMAGFGESRVGALFRCTGTCLCVLFVCASITVISAMVIDSRYGFADGSM